MEKRNQIEQRPDNFDSLLFSQARTMAINNLCLRLEVHLCKSGFPNCSVTWGQGRGDTSYIILKFYNPNKDANWVSGNCRIILNEERIPTYDRESIDNIYFTVKEVRVNEEWSGRQPAKLKNFRGEIRKLDQWGIISKAVDHLNYPFSPIEEFPKIEEQFFEHRNLL